MIAAGLKRKNKVVQEEIPKRHSIRLHQAISLIKVAEERLHESIGNVRQSEKSYSLNTKHPKLICKVDQN